MTPKDKKDLFKVALISDLHMDWDYQEGMSNVCGRPVCCRSDSGHPKSPEMFAGKWGDYQCDPPKRTIQHMLDHISNEVKPDAVFWGGDSIPHNLDSLNLITNVNIMKNATKLVADGLKGYDVFPTMGNHDTYPQD
jgi:sphingomyelin phosphodiesterase